MLPSLRATCLLLYSSLSSYEFEGLPKACCLVRACAVMGTSVNALLPRVRCMLCPCRPCYSCLHACAVLCAQLFCTPCPRLCWLAGSSRNAQCFAITCQDTTNARLECSFSNPVIAVSTYVHSDCSVIAV